MNKAITVKYLPQTGVKGARFRASDSDGNSKAIPYPYELSAEERPMAAAIALSEKMGWDTARLVGGELKPGTYVYTEYPRGMKLVDSSVVDGMLDALKEACALMNYDGKKPMERLLEARAVCVAAIEKAKGA